jgi:hypothetical protein
VVVKALASDPEERFPDARSFLAALGAVTLAPTIKARSSRKEIRCPACGAKRQTGRFCRKCGTRLDKPESILDEPIQITKVEVGHVEVGKGVEIHQEVIAQPLAVATGDLGGLFPVPLEMPELDCSSLWPTMTSPGQDTGEQDSLETEASVISMPEPPIMPVIDWAEVAPPMPDVPVIEDENKG